VVPTGDPRAAQPPPHLQPLALCHPDHLRKPGKTAAILRVSAGFGSAAACTACRV
jgi:hypothetical protein